MIPFRAALTACLMAAAIMLCAPITMAQAGWDISKHDGREYVPLESVKRFYNFNKLTRSGKSILLESPKVEMRLTSGGHECLMNGVKFVFTHKVVEIGGRPHVSRVDLAKLIDPVLRPRFIKNAGDFRTVILDPGHGGHDPGATNPLGTESRYNLRLAQRIKPMLESRGYRVVMTRDTDRFLSLQQRVDLANAVGGKAIYISIHFNAGGSHARGIETFTLSPPGVSHYGRGLIASDNQMRAGNHQDSANIALATSVHGSVLRRLGNHTFDRGIKRARFTVLSGIRHPAILFEGGFMSHPREARLIDNDAYQNALANGIVDAVVKYRFAVGNKPAASRN
jgi:N-acetylmuramoyl-L-alanine amidase